MSFDRAVRCNEVTSYPVAAFRDGFGRLRPAQIGACSFEELASALWSARASKWRNFVIVSHNFEMLQPGSTLPDAIVVKRFEKLCSFLGRHRGELPVCGYPAIAQVEEIKKASLPTVSGWATARRYAEQALRRLNDTRLLR